MAFRKTPLSRECGAPLMKKILFYGMATFLALTLCEAGARLFFYFSEAGFSGAVAEDRHCQHDPLLGWSHVPGLFIPDMYGQRKNLTINYQGFRAPDEYSPSPSPGVKRVFCLGDSFVLGYGVGDQDTFPHHLETMGNNLEVINMGQGGYGLDQMFLWYNQERANFGHHVLLLCYIDDDICRMNTSQFGSYGKPWIHVDGRAIRVENVPVPDYRKGAGGLFRRMGSHLALRRMVSLTADRLGLGLDDRNSVFSSQEAFMDTALALFEEVRQYTREHNIELVLVRLPTVRSLEQDSSIFLALSRHLDDAGFTHLNLLRDFRKMPPDKLAGMFIHQSTAEPEVKAYMGYAAHYTSTGNQTVARLILERALPENIPPAPVSE